jgi:hypothetical protein
MRKVVKIFFILTFFLLNRELKSQIKIQSLLDIGSTQISDGFYSQFSAIGSFEQRKWGVQGGTQLGLIQPQDVIFNSWYASPYAKLKIGNTPLVLGGEYLWIAISPDLRETNWLVFARTSLTHWELGLGTSTRTYRLSYKAEQPFESDSRITERWNIMYNLKYLIKPPENKWNLSFTLTDFDHFIIMQENNPMYNMRFDYKLSAPLSLYSELWYKSAGLMVIKVTYYGMFLRLGLLWDI